MSENRPLDQNKVEEYARLIREGEWANENLQGLVEQVARGEGRSRLPVDEPFAALAAKVKITVEYPARLAYDEQDDWQRQANSYSVTLRYQRRQMRVDFWMGSGISREPTSQDVLGSLLSDASWGDQTFDDWCDELGYDTDSRKAEKTYRAVQVQTKKLRKLLGDDFDTFVAAERG